MVLIIRLDKYWWRMRAEGEALGKMILWSNENDNRMPRHRGIVGACEIDLEC